MTIENMKPVAEETVNILHTLAAPRINTRCQCHPSMPIPVDMPQAPGSVNNGDPGTTSVITHLLGILLHPSIANRFRGRWQGLSVDTHEASACLVSVALARI